VKLGSNASGTSATHSEACVGNAVKKSGVSEWHKQFREGQENAEDDDDHHHDERSGRLKSHGTDENVQTVRNLAHSYSQPSLFYGNTEAVT